MKLKKLLSLGMATVMTAALAVPAFASNEVDIVATYQAVTINVDVPSDTTATINPYKLPIEIAKSDSNKVQIAGQQIVTQPTVAFKNKMAMDMNVSITATGSINALPTASTATPMRFATEALTAETTSKSAYVYVQAKAGTYAGAGATGDANTIADKIIDDYVAWVASDYDADKDLLVKAGTTTKENIITLKAATMETAANGGGFKEYVAGSIGLLRVTGQVVTSPKEAWTTDDGFTVKLAYTIAPAD